MRIEDVEQERATLQCEAEITTEDMRALECSKMQIEVIQFVLLRKVNFSANLYPWRIFNF